MENEQLQPVVEPLEQIQEAIEDHQQEEKHEDAIYISHLNIQSVALNTNYSQVHMSVDAIMVNQMSGICPIKVELWVQDETEKLLTDTRMVLTGTNPYKINLETELDEVKNWSGARPYCYYFKLVIKDEAGEVLSEKLFTYGFRFVQVKNNNVYINGHETAIKAIIYNEDHKKDSDPVRYMEVVKNCKYHNVNTILVDEPRDVEELCTLCDQYGIYIMKNLTHNVEVPVEEEEPTCQCEEVLSKEIFRYKNHPSIIMWALTGVKHLSMKTIRYMKVMDRTRPIYVDYQQMPYFDQIVRLSKGIKDGRLWQDEEERQQYAGVIMGHYQMMEEESVTASLVDTQEQVTAYAYEMKKYAECIQIEPRDLIRGIFTITNLSHCEELGSYHLKWEILEDGMVIKTGELEDKKLPIREATQIQIDYAMEHILENAWYHINIHLVTGEETWWAPKEHIVAWAQYRIPYKIPKKKKIKSHENLRVRNRKLKVEIASKDFEIIIDKLKGHIKSAEFNGTEYLLAPMKLIIMYEGERLEPNKVKEVKVYDTDGEPSIEITRRCSPIKGNIITTYTVRGDGSTHITHRIRSSNRDVRVGMALQILGDFNDLSWFGKGPHNTTIHVNRGAKEGLYYCNLGNSHQKKHCKSGIRWAALTDGDGEGILLESDKNIPLIIHGKLREPDQQMLQQALEEVNGVVEVDVMCSHEAKQHISYTDRTDEEVYGMIIKRIV